MLDSQSRAEQKYRNDLAKEERERAEENRIIMESKMIQK